MKPIQLTESGLTLVVATDARGAGRLIYFGREETLPAELPPADDHHPLLSIQGEKNGLRVYSSWGAKQNVTSPGADFIYDSHRETQNAKGRKVEMDLTADSLAVTVHWQFFTGIPVMRTWVEIRNRGSQPTGLEQVASFFFHGLGRAGKKLWNEKSRIHLCANSWCGEVRWQTADIRDLGLDRAREMTSNRLKVGNNGSWSTKDHLPMGIYENTEAGEATFWQIENNGSWNWEIGDSQDQLYLLAQGPNEADNHWFHFLQPGESFQTVPVAVGIVPGGFNEAIAALTDYRRRILHPHWDNEKLPVIFNDYANCLGADPTTEKELPYIQAAKEMGAEIYVIDAGWYATKGENWWNSVGAWQPSPDRFDGGILGILQVIRDQGMIPGLWLELEVMGIDCPLVREWPPECFFRRHGQPIVCRGRYQLDFRHPIVTAHADEVVDRLVNDYGVGFIKMDYNIDSGIGTEVAADSFGDGLLQHNRAYLTWLERVFARHPRLIVENCSSGGLRMDYALLARHSLQSITDQENAAKLARIAAMGPSAVVPEQLGVWVYPKKEDDRERVILNCVNALFSRFYLSGQIAFLSPDHRLLVQEAVVFHKAIRNRIRTGIPFWPLGPLKQEAGVAVLGLRTDQGLMLAAWNFLEAAQTISIPLPGRFPKESIVSRYPHEEGDVVWLLKEEVVSVRLPPGPSARATLITWT
jgi:alpha-galactosidase